MHSSLVLLGQRRIQICDFQLLERKVVAYFDTRIEVWLWLKLQKLMLRLEHNEVGSRVCDSSLVTVAVKFCVVRHAKDTAAGCRLSTSRCNYLESWWASK